MYFEFSNFFEKTKTYLKKMIEINNDKIQKLTIRRHASASKVIFRHPICIVRAFDFELIRIISVAENMDEKKTSFGFEPF